VKNRPSGFGRKTLLQPFKNKEMQWSPGWQRNTDREPSFAPARELTNGFEVADRSDPCHWRFPNASWNVAQVLTDREKLNDFRGAAPKRTLLIVPKRYTVRAVRPQQGASIHARTCSPDARSVGTT
jgi:hypothetical protein